MNPAKPDAPAVGPGSALAVDPRSARSQVVLLADQVFAQASSQKWCIMGVFDNINADKFPAVHTNFGVFVQLHRPPEKFNVTVRLDKADGTTIVELVPTRVLSGHGADQHAVRIGIRIGAMLIPEQGEYWVRALIDGAVVAQAPLSAALTPEKGAEKKVADE